jgi:putative membrane protein
MKLLLRWLVSALALILVAYLVPGISVSSLYAALVAALILGLINALIRPVILLLTLPINILTIGLFTLVINALMFWLASSVVKGFYVSGFWAAFWGAIIMWLVGWVTSSLFKNNDSR